MTWYKQQLTATEEEKKRACLRYKFPERSEYIIDNYISLPPEKRPTQRELGEKFNIGREGIRCAIARTFRRLAKVKGIK